MSLKQEFSRRLCAAMTMAGMDISGTMLERAFNRKWTGTPISVQTAWGWINGKTIPRQDKLQTLARLLKTDPHTLQYGVPPPLSIAERKKEWEDRITYAERETLEAFLRLPSPQRLVVREVIMAFAGLYGQVEPFAD